MQGIDYSLLTNYLPFTHMLVTGRLEAGCQLPVIGCRLPVTTGWRHRYREGGRRVTCSKVSGAGSLLAALPAFDRDKIHPRTGLLYKHLSYKTFITNKCARSTFLLKYLVYLLRKRVGMIALSLK